MKNGHPTGALRSAIEHSIRVDAVAAHEEMPQNGDFELNLADWESTEEPTSLREAAVLVPLIQHEDGLTVLLTRRADHLYRHAGQISFPGGAVEEQDKGPIDTALRETEEEVGLGVGHVAVAGFLDPYQTGTGYRITPVVGFVTPGFQLSPDSFEVAEVFEVPLAFLFDTGNHKRHSGFWDGRERHYHAMPYGDYYIWGATAGMLMNLYRRVHGLL